MVIAEAPWLLKVEGVKAYSYELAWRLDSQGMTARVLRGTKMITIGSTFNEFGAALQFPDYFGENWAALDECLRDLSWLRPAQIVLIITDSVRVLSGEDVDSLCHLKGILTNAAREWAKPIQEREPWDRPVVPFHAILQAGPGECTALREQWGQDLIEFIE